MIIKAKSDHINIPQLLEELSGLPILNINVIASYKCSDKEDDNSIIGTQSGVEPILKDRATLDETNRIYSIIANHENQDDYKSKRYAEYDNIPQQMNDLWDAIDSKGRIDIDSTWYKKIKSVKEKHPKGAIT
jgi:hypothetical protein